MKSVLCLFRQRYNNRLTYQSGIKIIFVSTTIHDAMITPEEYEKRVKSPITDEDDDLKLPIPAVVTIIVLSSLIGIIIVCKAIFGL